MNLDGLLSLESPTTLAEARQHPLWQELVHEVHSYEELDLAPITPEKPIVVLARELSADLDFDGLAKAMYETGLAGKRHFRKSSKAFCLRSHRIAQNLCKYFAAEFPREMAVLRADIQQAMSHRQKNLKHEKMTELVFNRFSEKSVAHQDGWFPPSKGRVLCSYNGLTGTVLYSGEDKLTATALPIPAGLLTKHNHLVWHDSPSRELAGFIDSDYPRLLLDH